MNDKSDVIALIARFPNAVYVNYIYYLILIMLYYFLKKKNYI